MSDGAELRLTFKAGDRSGESVSVSGERFTIGRAPTNDLSLDDGEVSREHAEIRAAAGGFEISDLGSRNGVVINGQRATEPTQLRSGDEVQIGETLFTVSGTGAETRFGGPGTQVADTPKDGGETRMASGSEALTLVGARGPGAGSRREITGETMVVGRDPETDLTIDDEEVSRRHAELTPSSSGGVEIRDLGSRNGTWVNGSRISGPTTLRGGETVKIGETEFEVHGGAAETVLRPPGAEPVQPRPQAPPAQAPIQQPARPSVIQRMTLQKANRRATVLAGIAVLVAVAAVVLAVTGVFSNDEAPPSGSDIVSDVTPSTVLVNIYGPGNQRVGNGTGWVYDAEQGLIVTNAHVVNAGIRFEIVGSEGAPRRATVVGVAPCEDLALLRTNGVSGLETLPLGNQSDVKQGDRVFAVGYPLNASIANELVSNEGTVSVVKTRPDSAGPIDVNAVSYPNVMQIDATINPGNSGGPSVNDDGELVGVNTFSDLRAEDQNFAIGVDRVREIIPQLARGNSLGYGGFAVEAVPEELIAAVNPELAQYLLGLSGGAGALAVPLVQPNSNAAAAGLPPSEYKTFQIDGQPTDLPVNGYIVSVGGARTETRQDYCNAVQNVESGETVTVRTESGTYGIAFE